MIRQQPDRCRGDHRASIAPESATRSTEMLSGLSDAFSGSRRGCPAPSCSPDAGPCSAPAPTLTGPVYDLGFLDGVMTLMEKIESVPVPVIAAERGAIGAGLQPAMAADLRCSHPAPLVTFGQTGCVR